MYVSPKFPREMDVRFTSPRTPGKKQGLVSVETAVDSVGDTRAAGGGVAVAPCTERRLVSVLNRKLMIICTKI